VLKLGIFSILAVIVFVVIACDGGTERLDLGTRITLVGEVYYQLGYDDYQNGNSTDFQSIVVESDLDQALLDYLEATYISGNNDARKGIPSKAREIQENRDAILEAIASLGQ